MGTDRPVTRYGEWTLVEVTNADFEALYMRPEYRRGVTENVPYILLEKQGFFARFLTPYGIANLSIGAVVYVK